MKATRELNSKTACEVQDKIYRKMDAQKKIKIVSQFIQLAQKLDQAKEVKQDSSKEESSQDDC